MPFSKIQKELPLVAFLAQENWHFFAVGFPLQSLTQGGTRKGMSAEKKVFHLALPLLIMANSS
jgi:hypothetical protein